jgi:hypothetical protein
VAEHDKFSAQRDCFVSDANNDFFDGGLQSLSTACAFSFSFSSGLHWSMVICG